MTKIMFNKDDLKILSDTGFIKAKHRLVKSIVEIFSETGEKITDLLEENRTKLPLEIFQRTFKISKGENYRMFPYVVLDHPRIFNQENVFAFRSMFWWGHYLSFTFHLGGKYLSTYEDHIFSNLNELYKKQFYWCVNNTPWEYHFEEDNYKNLGELIRANFNFREDTSEKKFLKLSRKIKLNEIVNLKKEALATYSTCLKITLNQ